MQQEYVSMIVYVDRCGNLPSFTALACEALSYPFVRIADLH